MCQSADGTQVKCKWTGYQEETWIRFTSLSSELQGAWKGRRHNDQPLWVRLSPPELLGVYNAERSLRRFNVYDERSILDNLHTAVVDDDLGDDSASCNTHKDNMDKRATTVGTFQVVDENGITVLIRELYRSEGKQQVMLCLMALVCAYERLDIAMPLFLGFVCFSVNTYYMSLCHCFQWSMVRYDDACHLLGRALSLLGAAGWLR